jgi:hypothetical protein
MNAFPRSLVLLALGLAASACGEEKKTVAADTSAASAEPASKKPTLGGKLGAAVKAAESAQAQQAKTEDGPPEKGVFAPGAADKAIAPGAPPKVDVLGDGAEPRFALAYALAEGEQRSTVSVALRQQGQGGGRIDFAVNMKVEKGKDKKDAGPAKILGTVTGITLPPQASKEESEKVAKLKGSELRYDLGADGAMSNARFTAAKGGLETLGAQLIEGFATLVPPLPSKPVGVGAYWMVTDRLNAMGLTEVVRYRVFRVEKIEKDKASLTVEVRQYSTKPDLDAGNGQKLVMETFDSRGKGRTDWAASAILPLKGESQVQIRPTVKLPNGQQAPLQLDLSSTVAAAEPDKKK